jgi:hypothetical protein
MTVAELREKARAQKLSGLSKLRTKSDLIRALSAAAPAPSTTDSPPPVHHHADGETARKHPQAALYDERLGELPERYYDDSFVSLPIGPDALFFYWDFKPETELSAREGLRSPRAVLTLYARGSAVEHIDFALESRAYYVRALEPGETYEAEIYFVGEDGDRHRIGGPSNAVTLPPRGPSSIVDDRFVRLAWGAPLGVLERLQLALASGVIPAGPRGFLGSSPTGPVGRGTRPPPAPAR